MSPPPHPVDAPTPPGPRVRRQTVVAYLMVAVVAVGAGLATAVLPVDSGTAPLTTAEPATTGATSTASPYPTVGWSPPQSPAAPTPAAPVLRLPEPGTSAGRGRFVYDDRPGALLGRAGTLRRYRVAVEVGSGEDVRAFGTQVEQVLADPGSWIGSGRLRLQRVPAPMPYDFTIYLATAGTARRMCAAGGVDIRMGARPYTSCRAPGQVILNLDRWRTSVPHFVRAEVPLTVYRAYVVNHEVGHELGYRHERCPGRGRPAPVMMPQTLFLHGCVANPWPYRDGRRYAGPRL